MFIFLPTPALPGFRVGLADDDALDRKCFPFVFAAVDEWHDIGVVDYSGGRGEPDEC